MLSRSSRPADCEGWFLGEADARDGAEGTEERVMEYGVVDALDSNEQGIDSRCDAGMAMLSGKTDKSASDVVVHGVTWSDDVFLRQSVESNALLSRSASRRRRSVPRRRLATWLGRCV